MSSVGQAIGGLIGAVAGFFMGGGPAGALKGFSLGASIGGMLDPPKGPNQTGPRLADLSTQTSTYGTAIPRIYGTIATLGNIFWLQGDRLTEVVTVSKQKSGGKGGGSKATVTTYSYNATFAVGLCQGPIEGVRRIWVGANLIYDAGSDNIDAILASNAAASGFKVYLGTETQTADPRMAADKGAANVPGYRGLAYVVFYDFALKDYGNSLLGAQVKVEVVKDLTGGSWARQITVADCGVNFGDTYSPGVGRPYVKNAAGGVIIVGIVGEPTEYLFSYAGSYIAKRASAQVDVLTERTNEICCGRLTGVEYLWVYKAGTVLPGNAPTLYRGGATATISKRIDINLQQDRAIIGVLIAADKQSIFVLQGNVGVVLPGETSNAAVWSQIDMDGVVISSGTASGAFNWASIGYGGATNVNITPFLAGYYESQEKRVVTAMGAASGLLTEYEINSNGVFQILQSAVLSQINFTRPCVVYVNGVSFAFSGTAFNGFYIGASQSNQVPLADVISAECLISGLLQSSDIDLTDISGDVRGYRIAETGALRSALEPLQGAFPFDVIQAGYRIKFIPRGNSPAVIIPEADLGCCAPGDKPGVRITNSREMDSQLPRRVAIKYFDNAREYDICEQYAERLNTDTVNLNDKQLPLVLNATEAAGVAETLLYLYWIERNDVSFTVPAAKYGQLEPGDVVTITGEQGTYELRLREINYTSNGLLECRAKYNNSAVYTSTAQGEEGSSGGKTLAYAGASFYVLLDIPCMQDVFDAAGFPAAMCGYTSTWPGGVIYRSSDGGQTWSDLQAFAGAVPIGFATSALETGRTDIIDTANRMTVRMLAGELFSVTEQQILNGANHFAIGADGRWEIVAAKSCALQVDGSYILSDFLRGRFGTEWAMSTHTIGDTVVLLTDADMAWLASDTSSIGLSRIYRGITTGAAIDTDSNLDFAYNAVNLECLSPVYLNGSRHPSTNDWTLTWIRRSRIDGGLRNYVDVSLGETDESYEIDIYADGTYATVKRTLTAATATVAYTSAQQTADFGGNQTTLYVKVYQLSATVGRGYPLTATITR